MSFNFVPGQVALSDPYPNAPTVNSQVAKETYLKAVKLSSANFSTTGVNTLVAVLPADASIIGFRIWTGTALSGGGVTSPTLSIGTVSAGTQFTSALAITNTTGTYAVATPVTGIFQNYSIPLGSDINIWMRGACSTGNPTAGEIYVLIEYVR